MPSLLPDFDLDRYLPYRLTVIAARLSADLARQYKVKHGISIAEWRVLLNVGYSGDQSVRDIEKRVSLDKSKVSRAASRLEGDGYLTKRVDEADRRLVKLTLTDKGMGLLSDLIPLAVAYQARLDQILGPQAQALEAALDCLTKGTK